MVQYTINKTQLAIFIISALISVVFLILILFLVLNSQSEFFKWYFILLVVFIFCVSSIPLYLSITYLFEDLNKTIQFDNITKSLIIKKGRKEKIVKRSEIIAAYKVMCDPYSSSRLKFYWYKYVLLIKNGKERIFITNLICNPEDILNFLKIKYKTFYWNIPVLSRSTGSEFLTTDEFIEKVIEYEEYFINHSDEQLNAIIHDSKTYTEYARQAASNLLKKNK